MGALALVLVGCDAADVDGLRPGSVEPPTGADGGHGPDVVLPDLGTGPTDLGGHDAGGADGGVVARCFLQSEPPPRAVTIPAGCPSDPDFGPDLARTPATSGFGERAALRISGAFHAPWSLYLRTREETCQIMEMEPSLTFFEDAEKNQAPEIVLTADATLLSEIRDGTHPGWACLAGVVGGRAGELRTVQGRPSLDIFIEGRFDPARLVEKFQALPGVEGVLGVGLIRTNLSSVCIYRRGDVHYYILGLARTRPTTQLNYLYHRFEATPDGPARRVGEAYAHNGGALPPEFDPPECR